MSESDKPLKMYSAGARYPGEFSVVAACIARTHKEAKKLFWAGSGALREECDWQFTDMRVGRAKEHDEFVGLIAELGPHVIHDTAITRRMGWWCEGDKHCSDCGLAAMDGDFPVCDSCGLCSECGHDETCAKAAADTPQAAALPPMGTSSDTHTASPD